MACSITCQVGPDEVRSNALVEALAQLARRAAFNQLRTVEQLGYIVFLSAWSVELVRSLVRGQWSESLQTAAATFVMVCSSGAQHCDTKLPSAA